MKAAFLVHFTKFTTWPDDAFESRGAPLIVGIAGTDPFGDALDKAFKDKKCGERPILIERYESADKIGKPHLLFTTATATDAIAAVLRACRERPVLLIGDAEGVAKGGLLAGFYLEKANVRFEINAEAAKKARLAISSQLLKLARIVESTR